jgi:esterase/lipase
MITHWNLRLLGEELRKAGLHVFRFDYSCLGDSWGTFEQASVSQWIADVKAALQELADNSGVSSLSVVGLRLAPHWLTWLRGNYP